MVGILGLQRFDFSVQSRFVPGGFVLVNNALRNCPIERWSGRSISSTGGSGITAGNSRDGFFDRSSHSGALARIVTPTAFRLFCAFFRLCCIGQVKSPKIGRKMSGVLCRVSVFLSNPDLRGQ